MTKWKEGDWCWLVDEEGLRIEKWRIVHVDSDLVAVDVLRYGDWWIESCKVFKTRKAALRRLLKFIQRRMNRKAKEIKKLSIQYDRVLGEVNYKKKVTP